MPDDDATRSRNAKNVTSKGRSKVAEQTAPQFARPAADDPKPLIRSAINTAFEKDNTVRGAITNNLKERSAASSAITQRAQKVFSAFNPSRFSPAVRKGPNYLRPIDDLNKMQTLIIKNGLESINSQPNVNHSIRFAGNDELKKLGPSVKLTDLISLIDSKLSGRNIFVKDSAISTCKAEIEAKRRLQAVLDSKKNPNSPSNNSDPASKTQINSDEGNPEFSDITSDELVKANVGLQMKTARSPESQLQYSIPDRSNQLDIEKNIDTFQLRSGPSDVTSYHDFHNLQIAFQSIWTEMFDDQLRILGMQLYEKYVQLMDFTGVDKEPDPKISSVPELKKLLEKITGFAQKTRESVYGPLAAQLVGIDFHSASAEDLAKVAKYGELMKTAEASIAAKIAENEPSRLFELLNCLEKLIAEKYAFDVFAKDSKNFGVLVTYRQKWEPVNYQVGDLVSTIPLAPKEVRRYTTKLVTKKSRAVKEIDNSLQVRKKDSTDTSRVDAEIVNNASNKTNFTLTAKESLGGGDVVPYEMSSTQTASQDQSKTSQQVKKDFRESVLKSAEEYKQEHRLEIDTNESLETESTTFHEIQNPNDELAVTYLFYELQRTYRISEKIHKLTPVILVANDVPSPHQINDAWLLQHDWILNHVILDDSFRPALKYLSTSFVGAEINIQLLQSNVDQQKSLVEKQGQQIQIQDQVLSRALTDLKDAIDADAQAKAGGGFFDFVKSVFDPAGLIKGDPSGKDSIQPYVDYTKDVLARAEKEKARLQAQLEIVVTGLQVAIDKLSSAIKEHYNRLTEIDRLRLHVKDNILYYMQAIWNHEPPDQRFFRLYHLEVPIITLNAPTASVKMSSTPSRKSHFVNQMLNKEEISTSLPMPNVSITNKRLADVANLSNLLGYKGNYMMFPLTENNYLTLHMMQDYLDIGEEVTVRDPDEYGNYTLDELQEFAACVYHNDKETFNQHKDQFEKIIIDRLTSSRKESELVIVPTTSLYIEALVGTHPLLEDFKLIHRALDVKKVQAEVRHAELENIRLAARALKGKDEDPNIDKKIVIETDNKNITVPPDDN